MKIIGNVLLVIGIVFGWGSMIAYDLKLRADRRKDPNPLITIRLSDWIEMENKVKKLEKRLEQGIK